MSLTWGNFRWDFGYWDGVYLPEMVVDRTKEDVLAQNEKGFYNASDLNRVEIAVEYIAKLLSEAGYPVTVETKTNWSKTDYPTENEMQRFLYNIQLLQNRFFASLTAMPASMKWISHAEANNIERILLDLDEMRRKMIEAYRYCGTLDCGGDVL